MLDKKNTINYAIISWLIITSIYISHTPPDHHSHDIKEHVEYTEIIVKEKRLPKPYEGWETYHMPLYYIINSSIFPDKLTSGLDNDKELHIKIVNLISVIYGAVALWIIGNFLYLFNQCHILNFLTLLFISTTPKFVFVFSKYNNDSLATLLSIAIIAASYKLYTNFSFKTSLILGLLLTAGFYTKLSVLPCALAVFLLCCKNIFLLKMPRKIEVRIMTIIVLSFLVLVPWLIFHNYKYTGDLFPSNFKLIELKKLDKGADKDIKSALEIAFPLLNSNKSMTNLGKTGGWEWDKPWVYPDWYEIHPSTKRYNYISFSFVTSVIGEFIFTNPHVFFFWIILWIHFIAYLSGIIQIFKSPAAAACGLMILFSHITQIAYLQGSLNKAGFLIPAAMDYRLIAWNWILWAFLYTNALQSKNIFIRQTLKLIFIIGIIVQSYVLIIITGTTWK